MHRLSILALLLLAACATPLERCIASATKELRVVSGLIASTQANINRGYAIVSENYFVTEEQVCGQVDGLADAVVRAAAAGISHFRVDFGVGGIRTLGQQGEGAHDHSGLTVAALRRIQFLPSKLNRVAAVG